MTIRMEYDAEANAAYLRFSDSPVLESEEISPDIVLDFDEAGHIVGMEILDARQHLPSAVLTTAA